MKYINKLILGAGVFLSLSMSFSACTDDFDETNRNPNKMYEASFDFVFPGVVYNSMKTLQEINYRYLVSLARYNVHWFEQKDTEDYNKMLDLYTKSLKDLKKLENQYVGVEGYNNVASVLLTWKCYIYYNLVTTWGDVPLSEANQEEVKTSYKYDSQEEIYSYLLNTLDKAVSDFDVNGDKISHDPLFNGDIAKWRDFANTLRLQVALTIQNSDAALAETHIRRAMTGDNANCLLKEDAVFQFGADLTNDASWIYNAYTQQYDNGTNSGWGTYGAMSHNFYLYMRSYNDPRLGKFTQPAEGKTRSLLTNDTITKPNAKYPQFRDSIIVRYRLPYLARTDYKMNEPVGWIVATDPNSPTGEKYRSPFSNITKGTNDCIVSYDFMKKDAIMQLITLAEVNFMKAEVAVRYPGVIGGTAQQYYEDGVRASMNYWGVPSKDAEAYLQTDGVKWDTDGEGLWEFRGLYKADINGHGGDEAHLEQIWKQWYIADFFNGFAGWTLERRTRVMKYPPHFYNGSVSTEGSNGICDWMMERLLYPINEYAANETAVRNAVISLNDASPVPDRVHHHGDNFYTLLRFAAPQIGDIQKWAVGDVTVAGHYIGGEITYHNEFVCHPYGATYEEVLKTLGAKTDAELKSLVDYSANKNPYSTYDPANGKVVIINKDGTWKYYDEVDEEDN